VPELLADVGQRSALGGRGTQGYVGDASVGSVGQTRTLASVRISSRSALQLEAQALCLEIVRGEIGGAEKPFAAVSAHGTPHAREGTKLETEDGGDGSRVDELREIDPQVDLKTLEGQTETKCDVKLVLPAAEDGFVERIALEG